MSHAMLGRRAGLLLPLFSARSTRSWGIGDIADLSRLGPWLRASGLRMLQVLPVNDMATGQTSPYSALSAMAIEPLYIALDDVADVRALGEAAFPKGALAHRVELNASPTVPYGEVKAIKKVALRRAFDHFHSTEWANDTERAQDLRAYMAAERWWLDDYALFRVLHDHHDARPWWEWPSGLAAREPRAMAAARTKHANAVLQACWTQWIAQRQWEQARRDLDGIALVGDLPFMVSADSADVWAHQSLFSREASVGTPPDAFSETGQDWGLPVYLWDAMQEDDFGWLRARGRRMAAMFDAFRIDHLVGFYRTYWRPANGDTPFFVPDDEANQRLLGEAVIEAFASAGAALIAEDLGTIPDFVRASLESLRLPGYKVLRWERDWHVKGQPFHDPATYAAASLATTGTHDTDMLADWWDTATLEERRALLAIPGLCTSGVSAGHPFDDSVRDALIEVLMRSGSDLVVFPLQDLFGWRDRINVPATVGPTNWSWASPIPVDRLMDDAASRARTETLRAIVAATGRS
ncbi:4-alpha-glucanotransferase [Luteitalea pratensis]|uniref:4-alpha-glucanotransferase n=1 Tax=Luteitalea pratensis TaxID=1855912 RepID=A0A143PGB8_LUTPR|nr:4-alpha-glucanotransferase [Luteitalea pratensis]AMY07310.1 4-alpha-glucanotransferase [Luteitalea pratensis]